MSKRWLINYLLFFLIILFTWLGSPDSKEEVIKTLLPVSVQSIKRIKIETKDDIIEFNKPLDRWFITQPIEWPASDINLSRIASLVKVVPHSSLPNSEIDISTLGLRFPQAVISLNDDIIVFGDSNQIGSRRYVMVNDTVHLVTDNQLPFVQVGLTGFVDKTLLPQSLTLSQLKLPTFTLDKQAASWKTNKPFEGFSADLSNQLITNWQTLESTHIKKYSAKSTPLKRIIATTDQGEIEFYLISITPEIVLARPDLGLQYHFDDSYYYDLFSLKKQKLPLQTAQDSAPVDP